MHAWLMMGQKVHWILCGYVFRYTFQESTRLRGLDAGLEIKRMYEEGTVEHDPPVMVALATLVHKCQLLSN